LGTPAPLTQTQAPAPAAVELPPPAGDRRPVVEMPASYEARAAERLTYAKGLMQMGKLREGRASLLQLAEEMPLARVAPEALLAATDVVANLEDARRELRLILDRYPEAPAATEALWRIGEISFIVGDFAECITATRAFRQRGKDIVRLQRADVQIALALQGLGRYDEADQAFRALRAAHPTLADAPQVLDGHADTLMALGRFGEADGLLEQIERHYPSYEFMAKVLMHRGLTSEMLGRPEAARDLYLRTLQRFPRSLEAPLAERRLVDVARSILETVPSGQP